MYIGVAAIHRSSGVPDGLVDAVPQALTTDMVTINNTKTENLQRRCIEPTSLPRLDVSPDTTTRRGLLLRQ